MPGLTTKILSKKYDLSYTRTSQMHHIFSSFPLQKTQVISSLGHQGAFGSQCPEADCAAKVNLKLIIDFQALKWSWKILAAFKHTRNLALAKTGVSGTKPVS